MELRKGYRNTEIGVLPDDWDFKSIGDEIDLLVGFPFASSGYSESGIKLLRCSNIKRGNIDWSPDITEYWLALSQDLKKYMLSEGDIVIAMDGSLVGRSFAQLTKNDIPALLLQRVARVRSEKIDIGYLKEFICSEYFTKHCNSVKTVTAIPHISPKDIKSLVIPIPPTISEQQAIATALSDIDSLINSLTKLINKKKSIKQGALQELLTGKKRLEGFNGDYKKTEIGVIPETWEMKTIASLGTFTKGQGIKKDESKSGQIPCVRYGELYTLHENYIKGFGSFISPEVSKTSKRLKNGDILFAGSGETKEEIGKCAAFIYDFEAYVGGDVIVLSPNEGSSLFYGYMLNLPFVARQKATKGQGDAIVHISVLNLSSIKVPIPPIAEQDAIASVLFEMDKEIEVIENKFTKYKEIKQGMMQELLTGRIRLLEEVVQ